ncbi:MAG: hypothetical protein Q8Q23_01905 [bacterium]|nr:hypothetical protein [bacterium]
MTDLHQTILDKITKERIEPKPRWQFTFEHALVWLMALFAIIGASLATAAIIFNFTATEWVLRERLGWSMGKFILINLPYLWLMFLLILGVTAYLSFRHTKGGYRFTLPIIIGAILFASTVLGFVLHSYGKSGEWLEKRAQKHFTLCNLATMQRQMMWQYPEKGLIAGKVVTFVAPNKFSVEDSRKNVWVIFGDSANLRAPFDIVTGVPIKVIGRKIDEHNFFAEEIRPGFCPPPFMKNEEIYIRGVKIYR